MITAEQIRMARAGLNISLRELSKTTGIAQSTIQRFESGRGGMLATTLARLEAAFIAKGVEFQNANEQQGPGVRLRKSL
jgi:transcriptional regulator with XRE-family HTH domain